MRRYREARQFVERAFCFEGQWYFLEKLGRVEEERQKSEVRSQKKEPLSTHSNR